MIRQEPRAMAQPTDRATVRRKASASIRPADISCAFFAMAIRAGSATVVEKPIAKAKIKSHITEPLAANADRKDPNLKPLNEDSQSDSDNY